MSQSATAPEKTRMNVNVAGSIAVVLSASRQSSELLANAIIASDVSKKIRALLNPKKYKLEIPKRKAYLQLWMQ
jgi:hypothetical protein